MKKVSKKSVFLVGAGLMAALAVVLYLVAPSCLYNRSVDGLRKDAGMTIKTADIPDFKIVYAEGGTGETIIMLHGFGANKDYWMRFAGNFTPGYRVIIPDLPGFGDSSRTLPANYNIMAQVQRLNQLAQALNLTSFHLVGNSMGGNIAGNFAASYPDRVKTLALFDASGATSPVKSERDLLIDKGINPYFFKNMDEFDRLLGFNFYKPPRYPSFIKKYLAKQAAKAIPMNEKIYGDVRADYSILQSRLDRITAPALIVWGDTDKSIHISAMEIFAKNIRRSQTAIIKECGHLPMLEKPGETAAVYAEFLKKAQ